MAAAVTPAAKGKGPALIFAGVGLVVLLLIAGVGGYFVMHTMMNKTDANVAQTNSSSNPAGGAEVVGAHEIGRYWLQVNSDSESNSADGVGPTIQISFLAEPERLSLHHWSR
jgi:hypothetical protein